MLKETPKKMMNQLCDTTKMLILKFLVCLFPKKGNEAGERSGEQVWRGAAEGAEAV